MSITEHLIRLARRIAASILKSEYPKDLGNSGYLKPDDKENILQNLKDDKKVRDLLELGERIDKKAAWKSVYGKTIKTKTLPQYWKYAVAASIALLLSGSIFFWYSGNTSRIPNLVEAASQTIKAGTDKATLTLDDGSQVVLEKNKEYKGSNAISNGGQLTYTAKGKHKEELAYNILTVPRGGQFLVELIDGTKVWLNSESQLKYPVHFVEGEARTVELLYGEAYFDVSPSSENKGTGFSVITRKQEVTVLGTAFNITAYKDEHVIKTALVEGVVTVDNGTEKLQLKPGQVALTGNKDKITVQEGVELYDIVSWKDGVFSFGKTSLLDISKVLSRWYDVDFVFESAALEDTRFIGVFRKEQDLELILTIIKETKFINAYEIKDKTILLK